MHGLDYEVLWAKIEIVVVATMITLTQIVPKYLYYNIYKYSIQCGMELFGFDVIVDSSMKPWLLEVNSSPALEVDTLVDEKVKPKLIQDVVNAQHFETYQSYIV